jgi:hypothetical protein
LATKLVPIDAIEVRVCTYTTSVAHEPTRVVVQSQLVASGFVASPEAQRFQQETNRLSEYQGQDGPPEPKLFTTFLVTFANKTWQVNVLDAVGTAPPTNGRFIAIATTRWDRELQRFTAGSTAAITACTLGQSFVDLPTC